MTSKPLAPSEKSTPFVSQIVLASASPFRRQLLEAVGLTVMAEAAPLDETLIMAATPPQLAQARATAKAQAMAQALIARNAGGSLVIGCDQVLELEGEAFDKVTTREAAAARLTRMAGKTHYLHSAYSLVWTPSAPEWGNQPQVWLERLIRVPMPMRALNSAEINAYVEHGEWCGSVGCYQFENKGMQLFENVQADQATIVGLPVQDLFKELRLLGVNPLLAPRGPWSVASVASLAGGRPGR